ncbi:unnamed protein product [Caenorhabditis sp. 36 PRJEB53466]|nr:unnamed protein product [Caenorhabditis sp. 36 PRJEB53466]
MEALLRNADFRFFMQWPFGVLMGAQTFFSFLSLIVFYFAAFLYEGTSFVITTLTLLLVCSVVHNVIHVFGLHRHVFNLRGESRFLPGTLLVFFTSLISTVGMFFSTLIVLVAFIDSLRFSPRLIVVYAILSVTCSILLLACGRIVVLLVRAAPNGQFQALVQVVIEGDRTSRISAPMPPPDNSTSNRNTTTTTNLV